MHLSFKAKKVSWVFWLVALLALLISTTSHAQQTSSQNSTAFQAQQFRPWLDPNGLFQTQSAATLEQWNFMLGFMANYAHKPLVLRDASKNDAEIVALLGSQIGGDLVIGLGLASFLDLKIHLPVTLRQTGDFPRDQTFGGRLGDSLDGTYLGDLRVALKIGILDDRKQGLGLALQAYVGFPTSRGGKDKDFNGEDGFTFGAKLMLSKHTKSVIWALNLGYQNVPASKFLQLTIQHEVNLSTGLAIRVVPGTFQIVGDIATAMSLSSLTGSGFNSRQLPLELYLGLRWFPVKRTNLALNLGGAIGLNNAYGTPQFRILAGLVWALRHRDGDGDGVADYEDRCPKKKGPLSNQGCPATDTDGDGLTDDVDKCPKVAGVKGNKGCPWPDDDGDGIPNKDDKCPKLAGSSLHGGCPPPKPKDADKDGVNDKDDKCPNKAGPKENSGCPFADVDKDGKPDKDDRCPNKAGPLKYSGCPDTDGDGIPDVDDNCPNEPGLPSLNGCKPLPKALKKVQCCTQIYFLSGKSNIRASERGKLRFVVRVLKRNPGYNVEVIGHTDSVYKADFNMKLSRRRAMSVRRALIRMGIPGRRLIPKWFGLTRPATSNNTPRGRAKNRRVEFKAVRAKKK